MKNPVDDSKKEMFTRTIAFGLMLGGEYDDHLRWYLLEPYDPKTEREDRKWPRQGASNQTLGFRIVRSKP